MLQKLTLPLVLSILLSFSGCSEQYIYVKECPQLQTFEVEKMDNISYEVIES